MNCRTRKRNKKVTTRRKGRRMGWWTWWFVGVFVTKRVNVVWSDFIKLYEFTRRPDRFHHVSPTHGLKTTFSTTTTNITTSRVRISRARNARIHRRGRRRTRRNRTPALNTAATSKTARDLRRVKIQASLRGRLRRRRASLYS